MVAVLPALVAGPILGKGNISSMEVFKDFFGPLPGYLKEDSVFPIAGITDLAEIHYRALESKEANGRRLISNNYNLTTKNIFKLLEDNFAKDGYKVNNREVTTEEMEKAAQNKSFGVRFSLVSRGAGAHFDDQTTEKVLGLKFEKPEKSIIDGVRSLIKFGILTKN